MEGVCEPLACAVREADTVGDWLFVGVMVLEDVVEGVVDLEAVWEGVPVWVYVPVSVPVDVELAVSVVVVDMLAVPDPEPVIVPDPEPVAVPVRLAMLCVGFAVLEGV